MPSFMEGVRHMSKANGNSDGTSVHFALQGKGGVGKSLIASVLSQFFVWKDRALHAVDADPVNQRQFDTLMERILTETGTFVVDTGASTFIPLWHYLLENKALEFLSGRGRHVFVHTVITGGQALGDTLSGFDQLAETTVQRNLVVWLNEYFGEVKQHGARFSEMAVYRTHRDKIHGVVAIVRRNADTFGRDLEDMISRKLTFDEAVNGADFTIMAKQRLRVIQRDLFEQLDAIGLS